MFESGFLFETVIGPCGIVWSAAGLTGVQLPEADSAATAARLARRDATIVAREEVPAAIMYVAEDLTAFVAGEARSFDSAALDMTRFGAFERAIYAALRKVGWGRTVTYGELAEAAGAAGAARAAGAAMGRNAWPLIVPCHRVLAAGGRIGGFSAFGGAVTKQALLAREGVRLDGGQRVLFE